MAGFHDIIGHEKIKEHLQKAIGYQRVSHAYILSGEEGMGRKTIAKAFAMTLLCEKHGTEPCMECHSCKQFLSGNHPDDCPTKTAYRNGIPCMAPSHVSRTKASWQMPSRSSCVPFLPRPTICRHVKLSDTRSPSEGALLSSHVQ